MGLLEFCVKKENSTATCHFLPHTRTTLFFILPSFHNRGLRRLSRTNSWLHTLGAEYVCLSPIQLKEESSNDLHCCCFNAHNNVPQVLLLLQSNSGNDIPRVVQRYGTMGAHTRRPNSILIVFVVFLHAYVSFGRLDKADATADHAQFSVTLQSPTTTLIPLFSSSEHTGSVGSEKWYGHVQLVGVEPSTSYLNSK